jgi:hypothetical protein
MTNVEMAGNGMQRVRVAVLLPDIPNSVMTDALAKYGDVKKITEERWSRT